jgi:hypothetical protein
MCLPVFFAGWDWFLADPGDAVLFNGDFQAVPVDGGGFGEIIFEDDADAIVLIDLDCGTRATAVVAPCVDGFEGGKFAFYDFSGEAEDFCGAVEFVREVGDVGGDDQRAG